MQLFYKPQINGLNGSKPLFFSLHSLPTYTIFCFVAFNGAGSLTVKSCKKKRKEKNQDKRCKSSQCVGRYCKVCILWMKSVRPFKNYQDDTARFYTSNDVKFEDTIRCHFSKWSNISDYYLHFMIIGIIDAFKLQIFNRFLTTTTTKLYSTPLH